MSYTDRLFKEGSALTRFSHHARAEKTLSLIRASGKSTFNRVLDYGCADGWFLKALYDNGMAKQGVGVDINDDDLAKSRALFAEIPSFQFIKTPELSPDLDSKFDLAVCLETLEHVSDAKLALSNIHRLCAPDATVLLSVPIEVGTSLLMKMTGRYITGLRDKTYRFFNDEEPYSFREILEAGVLWRTKNLACSHNLPDVYYRGHKGFDYRKLRRLVQGYFEILSTDFSPFPFTRQFLNSTIYWRCKPKPLAEVSA